MARKLALIIGNSQYDDACLARLAAPDVDVRALPEVLQSPGIGAFDEVIPLLNEGLATVRKAIARFFDSRHRDDLLLLYFSGHGVRDEQGHLYLAVRDTERAVLAGTAIEASYVTARMDRSASKRLVLVLDCCHSGAFGYGTKGLEGASVGTAAAFEGTGRGRVVLTATDSTQYAWEGDQVLGDVENSLFTHYMIEGLRSGAADRDEDGLITIDELYDYVYEHVLNETPKQTPGKWAYGQQGDIVIAQNPVAPRVKLPPEIEEALGSKLPSVRLEAVKELQGVLRGRNPVRTQLALGLLKRLTEDDSRRVATAAIDVLSAFERSEPTEVEAPPDAIKEKEADDEQQREAQRQEHERLEREQLERERLEHEQLERERLEREQLERERLERERVERERLENERLMAERAEAERREAERAAAARREAAQIEEAARLEQERVKAEAAKRAARVAELLTAARSAIDSGTLEAAQAPLAEALGLEPRNHDALRVQSLLRERNDERIRLERAEQRIRELRQRIGTLIARANATENHVEAIALLDEALGLDPEHAEVRELLEDRHRLRAEADAAERRAQTIVSLKERIARHIERGELEDAERALEGAESLDAADAFEPEQRELAGLRAQRQREQEQAARHAREERLAQHLAAARTAIAEHRFADAVAALAHASALNPDHQDVEVLFKAAEEGRAAADAEKHRQEQIKKQVAEAKSHLTKGNLTKAIVVTDLLLQNDPENDAARALHGKIQQAIERQKEAEERATQARDRRRQIDELIAKAEATPAHDAAIEMLQDVLIRDPENDKALRLLRTRSDARRLELEIEAERAERQERLDRLTAEAHAATADQRYEDAAAALDEILEIDGQAAGARELRQAAQTALDQQRAAALAQQQIAEALRHAEKRARRHDRAGALQFLERALAIDPQHPRALALREEVQRAPDAPPRDDRARLIKIAAGVLVAAVLTIAVWMLRPVGVTTPPSVSPTSTADSMATSPASAPPPRTEAHPPEVKPEAKPIDAAKGNDAGAPATSATSAPVEAPKDERTTPEPAPPVRSEAVASAEATARRLLRGGRLRDAAATIAKGMAIDPNDAGLKDALGAIQTDARKRSLRAMTDVEKAGAPATGSKAFSDGKEMHAAGDAMQSASKPDQAIRDYLTAVQLFGQALQTMPSIASVDPKVLSTPPGSTTPPPSGNTGNGRPPASTDSGSTKSPSASAGEKPAVAPKPVDPPAPTPAATATPVSAAATPIIMRLIRQYESALESRDINKLRAIWPSMSKDTERGWRRSFDDVKSYEVEISNCSPPSVTFGAPNVPIAAAITCHEKDRITPKVSGRIDSSLLTTFVLRTAGSEWVISEVSKRPY